MSKKNMPKKTALIHFEYNGDGTMDSEVEGVASTVLNLFLNGIENTFADPILRAAFKEGIEQVYENWAEEEAKKKEELTPAKSKFLSGRVVCTLSTAPWWKTGKLYDVEAGYITDDEGDENGPFKDVEEMNIFLSGTFVEVVED